MTERLGCVSCAWFGVGSSPVICIAIAIESIILLVATTPLLADGWFTVLSTGLVQWHRRLPKQQVAWQVR